MVHLLISDQSLLLNNTIKKLTNSVLEEKNDFNFASFDFLTNSFEEILESLQSSSFGSDKKVVLIKNPYFFTEPKIKLPFNNNLQDFEDYLYNPNDDCELIIVCAKKYYNPKSKFITIIQSTGEICNLLIDTPQEIRNYALELLKLTNVEIEDAAINILLQRCTEITTLEKEIGKLSLYGQYIDCEIIKKLIAEPLENNIFELSNALMKKDIKKAMKIYTDLKMLKVEPINLISMLANQFRLIMQVSILRKKYRSDDDIANVLKVHPYRVKLAREYSYDYPLQKTKKMLVDLSQLDIDIKKGLKDRYIDLEIFLASC